MENVFLDEIKDWDTWGRLYQSIPTFKPLIYKIFEKEGLKYKEISHLTAGTNAVFRVDNFVVKIFAPSESGYNTEIDYNSEILGMKKAVELSINSPNVIAASFIEDTYLFRYIIMDYIDGKDAKDVLKSYSKEEKVFFVHQLKENLYKLNSEFTAKYPVTNVKERVFENTRWNTVNEKIVTEIKELVKNYDLPQKVYVHGDITGDNVMINHKGIIYIIDFADGRIAPKEYEYPPILFDLFDFDQIMIREFIGEQEVTEFVEECFNGILIHEFGVYFVKLICERVMEIRLDELNKISEIKDALLKLFTK